MIKKKIFMTIALLCALAQGTWAESENVTFNVRYWDTTNKQVVTTPITKEAIDAFVAELWNSTTNQIKRQ